ncbi:MAG TPA: endonuclease MutS2 [Anaerolineales bacterium]|nr:endonuclease MutS2 [Anaerolineales bacterium]
MDPKHWQTLELPKILERLASYTSFSAGAEKARTLTPSTDLAKIRARLEVTAEARALLTGRPQTTLGGARDIRPLVDAARRGVTLTPAELLDVRQTLMAARTLHNLLTRLRPQFPHLAAIAGRIAFCPSLIEAIGRCLDERGEVQDTATDALQRIRRDLRAAHERVLRHLERLVSSPENLPFLQEPLVTQRAGRYVVPLKADFKGRIPGIVHDRSASGATLFVEPLSAVELNNAWRELQIEEEQEVHRILTRLSARVASCGEEIETTVDALADLDLAFAKALYAEDLEAAAPGLVPFRDGPPGARATLRLVQARHPLLDPETVVPIDVMLDDETHVLVITGPNTGGKTVTLKTVGLLILMAQAGLHIPVAPGSALSPFAAVYADIGDEQSIEQSLSTFSAHLTNILSFINQADDRSLVLLDELGAGTDPAEGSALARALLETFRRSGATTLVATHYPELKAYAQMTEGVQNACVEFDPETLRPTYHLTIGLPGRSNAFAIARRLGLDEEIVRAAESMVSQEDRQTEALLADIHRLRLQAVQERDRAYAARREAEQLAEELRERLARIEEERAEILRAAREEAETELESLRAEIRALRRRLRAAAEPLAEVAAVERELEGLEERVEEELEAEPEPAVLPSPPPRPVRVGDRVWVKPLRTEGEVLALGETVEVQVGPARVQVAPEQVELRGAAPSRPEPTLPTYRPPTVEARIDLRGYTVEEALERLDRYLDAATLAGLPRVEIVHGKGTGALRRAVRAFLQGHPHVDAYRAGENGEGGEGVTVVTLGDEITR